MKTIKWTCQLSPGWQWKSGKPNENIQDPSRSKTGTITLEPNKDYWFPCVDVILQEKTVGNTWVCYYKNDGVDMIQAISCGQGAWVSEGAAGESFSSSAEPHGESGGIVLLAEFA